MKEKLPLTFYCRKIERKLFHANIGLYLASISLSTEKKLKISLLDCIAPFYLIRVSFKCH